MYPMMQYDDVTENVSHDAKYDDVTQIHDGCWPLHVLKIVKSP